MHQPTGLCSTPPHTYLPRYWSQGLAHALVAPLYMNAGGKTLFGTPWEMNVHPNTGYLVRRKGGNVPGYTALLAFVPEIKLSLSVLWSGGTDELGASEHAMLNH